MVTALYMLTLGICLVAGEPIPIMSVGAMDGKVDEFALAPDGWGKWSDTFQNNVQFRVGVDDPAHTFPFIHPGPMDAWAGHTSHTFTIEFELDGGASRPVSAADRPVPVSLRVPAAILPCA